MRIYNLAIRDRALVYAWFFLAFAIHIAFSIFAAVSPPMPFVSNWSLAGFICCIKGFDNDTFVGVVYVIGGVFWSLEALWSIGAIIYVSHSAHQVYVLLTAYCQVLKEKHLLKLNAPCKKTSKL